MGIPEGDGTVHEDCLGAAEAQINFRQFAARRILLGTEFRH